MAAPKYDLCQWTVQNPHASQPLHIPLVVLCNTSDEEMEANVRANTARDLLWLEGMPEHNGIALLVGGGPSVDDYISDIIIMQDDGATVFAMNAASQYLRRNGVRVDWQVTCDAKPETATLVDPSAGGHLFASHVNPATIDAARNPVLWHSAMHCKEAWFPPEKKKRGGYALLGGEASTGLGALCVAYCLGFRRLEIFGYDSCHRNNQSHAYRQKMNDTIPVMEYTWAGRTFQTSITMRAQAERFPITAQALQQAGATLNLWGDGLLQHIWRTPPDNISERDKYTKLWQTGTYRAYSPGEHAARTFLSLLPQDATGPVIDFGCGTGRGGIEISKTGLDVVLVDFVSTCRDQEALSLPFLEWDLTTPCPLRAPYGFCCDVMEHIPTEDVPKVLRNILQSANTCFFQISTVPDSLGVLIGQDLHLTVQPGSWWKDQIEMCGGAIEWSQLTATDVQFLVHRI